MPHAEINGARLWYDIIGEGEPLLLHHGYTASRVNWMPVADRLKDKYQIILMECRGTGESEDTQDGYSLAQYASDVVTLMNQMGVDKFTYAGHSMGGGIGYLLGLEYVERISRLILMAPIPAAGIPGKPDQEILARRLQARRDKDRDFFLAEMIATRFRHDVQTDAWFASRVDHLMRVSEGHVIGGLQTMHALDVEDRLPQLNIPTLMLAGAVDGLLAANMHDYTKLPDATLHVFSRAGHDVAIHEPAGVSDAIDQFMQHGPMSAAKIMARAKPVS
ncbi:MAG: alpha/beta hydrolase [bacterium]|nr:alpha/beta hydrolase [Gammaproteobacteria bacterium]HIL94994.1 alpha/beta hydrolase [Pseudomonadales bacterium]